MTRKEIEAKERKSSEGFRLRQNVDMYERHLEELMAFRMFVEELRQIKHKAGAIGIERYLGWSEPRPFPMGSVKVAKEIVHIQALAGVALPPGRRMTCGNIRNDLEYAAEILDSNIEKFRVWLQGQLDGARQGLSVFTKSEGTEDAKEERHSSNLRILPSSKK